MGYYRTMQAFSFNADCSNGETRTNAGAPRGLHGSTQIYFGKMFEFCLNYTNYDSIPVLITVQQFKEIKLKLHSMSN